MTDKTVELDHRLNSLELNDKTITDRFGKVVFERNLRTKEELTPIVALSNMIRVKEDIPGSADHAPGLVIRKGFGSVGNERDFGVQLEDRIYLNSLIPDSANKEKLRKDVQDELEAIHLGKTTVEETKYLSKIVNVFDGKDGWELIFNYYGGETDDGHGDSSIRLIRDNGNNDSITVTFDVWYFSQINIKLPLFGGFDDNIASCQNALEKLTNCLGFKYTPQLQYEFKYPPGAKVEGAAEKSTTFNGYFYNTLNNWKNRIRLSSLRLRAIIGEGKTNEPILLLEDDTIQSARTNSLERFMTDVNSTTFTLSTPLVYSHEDIFTGFSGGIRDNLVNTELAAGFPGGDANGWLHMFVDLDENGHASLVEDARNNLYNKHNRELVRSTLENYGMTYGGVIPEEVAEKMAKSPMLLPKINNEVAIIEKKYGNHAASIYRKAATNFLINGDRFSKEVYDSYQTLLRD